MLKLSIRLILVKPENDFSLFRRENGRKLCNENVHEKKVSIEKNVWLASDLIKRKKTQNLSMMQLFYLVENDAFN